MPTSPHSPSPEPSEPSPDGRTVEQIVDDVAGAVLHAARDIAGVGTALEAEMLLSTLLGRIYAGARPDRADAARSFADILRSHLAKAGTPTAGLVGQVLSALSPAPSTEAAFPAPATEADGVPRWLSALGRVRAIGAYAYGDRYGDQTSYLATYAYDDEELGGPPHAVLLLADHELGLINEIVVAVPADQILDQLKAAAESDPEELTWFSEVDPAVIQAAATTYLRGTDTAAKLAGSDSLPANMALALARLALLPEPERDSGGGTSGTAPDRTGDPDAGLTEPDAGPDAEAAGTDQPGGQPAPPGVPPAIKQELLTEFLTSPEARMAGLAGENARHLSAIYCGGLFVDFAAARSGDPLRWSPRAVERFLLHWVHERAILDADDVATLPDALAAWVFWAGRRLDLPEGALRATFDQVAAVREEFVRVCATGERQSPAVRAMVGMMADGVDLDSTEAVGDWLRDHQTDLD